MLSLRTTMNLRSHSSHFSRKRSARAVRVRDGRSFASSSVIRSVSDCLAMARALDRAGLGDRAVIRPLIMRLQRTLCRLEASIVRSVLEFGERCRKHGVAHAVAWYQRRLAAHRIAAFQTQAASAHRDRETVHTALAFSTSWRLRGPPVVSVCNAIFFERTCRPQRFD